MQVVWQVEIDDWCRRVLAKHWPDAERFADVREVGAHNLAPVDVIAGGFPCQDISIAGRAAGITGARSGLWSEFARLIGDLRPRYVLVENVPALIHRGLGVVLGDLAACGYDAEWDCIPAAAVGAPHLRDRIWIVAARTELGWPLADADDGGSRDAVQAGRDATGDGGADVEDANGGTVESRGRRRRASQAGQLADPESIGRRARREGRPAPTSAWAPESVQAVPDADGSGRGEQRGTVAEFAEYAAAQRDRWWGIEPNVGRVAHGVPARVDRLRGLGNAVVPQVVEWIGRRIIEADAAR